MKRVESVPANRAGDSGRLPRGRPPFRDRLYAWWEGIDLPLPDEPAAAERPTWVPPPEPSVAPAWPRRRIDAAQVIWGADFIDPGGAELTVELAKPFGAGPVTSLVDLHAGLGGGTRAIAKKFGVWVTGLEPEPELAQEAHGRSRALALERKAPVASYDPERYELKPESVDCVFARESFYLVSDKDRLLRTIHQGLRQGGQLIFTDLLTPARPSDGDGGALERWAAAEHRRPLPWNADRMGAALAKLGFDLRIQTDLTSAYRGLIKAAFKTLVERIEARAIEPASLAPVLEEADRWARRLAAIDRGELQLHRFHGIKRPG